MKNRLLSPASTDDLIRLLRAWRFWLLGGLLGGLMGAAFYVVFPPDYRAIATVTVDFNLEQSWPDNPDSQLFYYLDRESRKLAEVAGADVTLQQVAAQTGMTIPALRSGKLELSQPQDGGWHFYAYDPQPDTATRLAGAWAEAFVDRAREGIQTEVALDAARKALQANPNDEKLKSAIKDLEKESLGITPELQVALMQSRDLPVARKTSLGTYTLAGAGLFLAVSTLAILFIGQGKRA